MKNWLDPMDPSQRLPPCSQPMFPAAYCTCKVCFTIRQSKQEMVLVTGDDPSQELIGLYNRLFAKKR